MKLREASAKIAPGTEIAMLAKVKGSSWGIICLKIILISGCPISFAASTYWKFFICNARLREILAVPIQPKKIKNKTIRNMLLPINKDKIIKSGRVGKE